MSCIYFSHLLMALIATSRSKNRVFCVALKMLEFVVAIQYKGDVKSDF